LESGVEREV
jgi:hypothetical protein